MRRPIETRPLADIEADWPRLSGLLDEIMNLPPASREAFIGALTPPDDRLADTLRELLALQAKVETEDFMDDLPVFPGVTDLGAADAAGAAAGRAAGAGGLVEGAEVGPYRLLRAIGEGGMGAVWLAERADGTLKRKVALKLPRLAWAQDLAVRMARERDILSALEHPNIARLYDAGIDAVGRPWLAIEYVEGRDLAAFCDVGRLDLRARVRLFLQVLDAVQYAHASLVIHRDIKPANILVTPRGEVRLLDFGIARLEEGAPEGGPDLTRTGVSAMTPRYASPEQVRGGRLAVASDIYSLGVVLHELLTGETPYVLRRESRAELEQAILDADLRVPSRLRATAAAAAARAATPERIARELRGDLDAVLLRSLALEPSARYASAAAFRDDLERWLEGRPVAALPPSRLHSLRKFVARNRLAVGATAAAALALVAVSVVAVLQAQRATRSAAEAQAEAARANATKEFLLSTYAGADPTIRGGRDATAKELLIEAEKQLDTKLNGQLELQAEVLRTLEIIWDRLGDVDRSQAAADRRTEVLLRTGEKRLAAESALSSAETSIKRRDFDDVGRAISGIESMMDGRNMPPQFRARLAYAKGALYGERGDTVKALSSLDEAVRESRQAGDGRLLYLGLISRVFIQRLKADPETTRRDIAEAESLLPTLDLEPVDALGGRFQLVIARYLLGDYQGGWPDMQRIIKEGESLYGVDNPGSFPDRTYWIRYCLRLGESELVVRWLRESTARGERSVLHEFARDPNWSILVARVKMAKEEWRAAEIELDKARSIVTEARSTGLGPTDTERWFSRISMFSTELALRQGRSPEAKVIDSLRRGDESSFFSDDVYRRWWVLGLVSRQQGQVEKAIADFRRAEDAAMSLFGAAHPEVSLLRLDMALAAARSLTRGSDGPVASVVRDAVPVLRKALPSSHPALRWLNDLGLSPEGRASLADADVRQRLAIAPNTFFFL